MREIKFRGKRLDNGKWVYGFFLGISPVDNKKAYIGFTDNTKHTVDSATVGQFTGLQDNDERDIYEGDFLKSGVVVYECEWNPGKFVLRCGAHSWRLGSSDQMKIIGNIHDNPELLKQE